MVTARRTQRDAILQQLFLKNNSGQVRLIHLCVPYLLHSWAPSSRPLGSGLLTNLIEGVLASCVAINMCVRAANVATLPTLSMVEIARLRRSPLWDSNPRPPAY